MSEFKVKGVEGIFTSRETTILADAVNTNASALMRLKKELEALKKEIENINTAAEQEAGDDGR